MGGLDIEFKENCRIEGAGITEGSKEILLGQRLTAVRKTLFTEIEVDWVTVLYRGPIRNVSTPHVQMLGKFKSSKEQCPTVPTMDRIPLAPPFLHMLREIPIGMFLGTTELTTCLLYTSPSPRD